MGPSIEQTIASHVQRVAHQNAVAWEAVLRLHIKARPRWMPEWCWRRVVNMVVIQSEQRIGMGQ